MKKTKLIIFLTILIVFIAITIYWTFAINVSQKKITTAINLVKQKIGHQINDSFRGCVYDENLMIVSLNHQDYFVVKDDKVKVYDAVNDQTKERYPNVPINNEFEDFYWVLENCH